MYIVIFSEYGDACDDCRKYKNDIALHAPESKTWVSQNTWKFPWPFDLDQISTRETALFRYEKWKSISSLHRLSKIFLFRYVYMQMSFKAAHWNEVKDSLDKGAP